MKKILSVLMISALLILSGCDQQQTNTAGEQQAVAEQPTENMTAGQILAKAQEMNKDISSIEATMFTTMKMIGTDMPEDAIKMDMDMKFNLEPLFMHMVMDMGETAGVQMGQVEMYMDKEFMYMQIPGSETTSWIKMKQDETFMDPDQYLESFNADEYLSIMKEVEKDFTVEDTEEGYLLTYQGDGQALMEQVLKNSPIMDGEEMPEIKINALDYKYLLNKTTYEPIRLDMDAEYQIEEGETPMTIQQTMKMDYKSLNQPIDMTIPQEALDAVEQ